jgi:hypothetical protein
MFSIVRGRRVAVIVTSSGRCELDSLCASAGAAGSNRHNTGKAVRDNEALNWALMDEEIAMRSTVAAPEESDFMIEALLSN